MKRRPVVLHLTTVDMSLALLLLPQLVAFREAGYDVVGGGAVVIRDVAPDATVVGVPAAPIRSVR